MTTLYNQVLAAGFLDWLAILTSLAYVWLAARDNNWCWLFAAISTAAWAWQSFFVYRLVSDGFLQLFYLVMAGVGLWRWRGVKTETLKPASHGEDLLDLNALPARTVTSIRRMRLQDHALVIGGGLISGLLLDLFVSGIFFSAATLPDALTTAFSIITTFLLVWRKLENWLYWVVIDAAYVWIYLSTEAVLFAAMMVLNIGMALYGYVNWRREMTATNTLV
jgi:nicotinamide mononucleotide transporter